MLAKVALDVVVNKRLVLVLVDSLKHFNLFLRVVPHLLLLILFRNRVNSKWQLRLALVLGPGDQIQSRVGLQVVWVVVSHLFAHWLLRHLVDVLVIANVDSSMDE